MVWTLGHQVTQSPHHLALEPSLSEVGLLLANPGDFDGLNDEYSRWFPSNPPTRHVAKLGVDVPGLLVSIRMTAFVS